MTTKDKIEENSNSAPGFICSFCGKEAIDVSEKDLYFGCPKHIHKAKKETTIELGIIARIGFNEWVKRKPRLKNIICCPVIAWMPNKLVLQKYWDIESNEEKIQFIERAFMLIEKQKQYISLLNEEINSLIGVASSHGWKSNLVEQGTILRKDIDLLYGNKLLNKKK